MVATLRAQTLLLPLYGPPCIGSSPPLFSTGSILVCVSPSRQRIELFARSLCPASIHVGFVAVTFSASSANSMPAVPLGQCGVAPWGRCIYHLHISAPDDSTSLALAFVNMYAGPGKSRTPGLSGWLPVVGTPLISARFLQVGQEASSFRAAGVQNGTVVTTPRLGCRSGRMWTPSSGTGHSKWDLVKPLCLQASRVGWACTFQPTSSYCNKHNNRLLSALMVLPYKKKCGDVVGQLMGGGSTASLQVGGGGSCDNTSNWGMLMWHLFGTVFLGRLHQYSGLGAC